MADRIIELTWTCADCGNAPILGRHKTCPTCGSPREKGEMRMAGLENTQALPSVSAPALLELAQAGFDWFCTHCSAGNRGDGQNCGACGAPRYGERAELHPDLVPAPIPGADFAQVQVSPAGPPCLPPAPPAPPDEPEPAPTPEPWARRWPLLLAGCAALCLLLVWATTTHDVPGEVTARAWTRTVHAEKWTQTTARLWKHKTWERAEVAPVNGTGETAGFQLSGGCRQEHYENERYVCGSHQECNDVYRTETSRYACGETCSSNGNGFASCRTKYCTSSKRIFDHKACHQENDYCTRPIYKARCDYATQEWRPAGSYPTAGAGASVPAWGQAPNADTPLIRLRYSTTHTITWSYQDRGVVEKHEETYNATKDTRAACEALSAQYATWPLGARGILAVRNLGGVATVQHPGEAKK